MNSNDLLDRLQRAMGSRSNFRRHRAAFVLIAGGLLAINFVLGGGWWSFWPTYVWAMVFALHFFIHRALTIDESWIDERAGTLGVHSYDFAHIIDMKHRIARGDLSVKPSDERVEGESPAHRPPRPERERK